MKKLSYLILVFGTVALSGCVGNQARDKVLAPAVVLAWPTVMRDALLGVQAQQDVDFTTKTGITLIGPGVAESKVELISNFDSAVQQLK